MALDFRGNALLQYREVLEFTVEMPSEQEHSTFQSLASIIDRALTEPIDGKCRANRGCSHQHEAAGDQPTQRRDAPASDECAHTRPPTDYCPHAFLPWNTK